MKELGITKGEWSKFKTKKGHYKISGYDWVDFAKVYTITDGTDFDLKWDKIAEANAELIADAGTTANKCGMLPSELLQRYNEAIEVLKLAHQHLEYCGWGDDYESECAEEQGLPRKIEQTISKAKRE